MKIHLSLVRCARMVIIISALAIITETFAQNTIIINTDKPGVVISKHLYGHFAEHLGRCIYDGMYIGEQNNQISHTDGVRNDVIEALRKLKVPNLRWPGGCFADTYQWKDGIGDKAKRPKIVNVWWGGVTEDNSFGTHDFLNLCERIGAEPYLAANVGSGTVKDFSDWVQYVNFSGVSPMSDLRQKNGREKPWNVTYWGVGNEAWGCGGNMKPEYYANLYRQYATFMTGSNLFRIASGANSSDYNWTEVLMREIPLHLLEGVALHHYSVIDWNKKGSATDFSEEQYFKTMQRAMQMGELVTKHAAIMDKYDPQRKVALVVDEWGGWYDVEKGTNPGFLYQQNTMRDAMIAGVTLNIFQNHADRVRMANLAQVVNVLQAVILTDKEKILLTPTYHVMEMYNVHQEATQLPVTVESVMYSNGNEKLPALSVSASVTTGGIVHISIANIDSHNELPVEIQLGAKHFKTVSGRVLTSEKVNDHNTFEAPNKIIPKDFAKARFKGETLVAAISPCSVVVLEVRP